MILLFPLLSKISIKFKIFYNRNDTHKFKFNIKIIHIKIKLIKIKINGAKSYLLK